MIFISTKNGNISEKKMIRVIYLKRLTYILIKEKWNLYGQNEIIYSNNNKKEKESYKHWSWLYDK